MRQSIKAQTETGFFCGVVKKLEPAVGFEPTTDGLQNRCSTTELCWLPRAGVNVTKVRENASVEVSFGVWQRLVTLRPAVYAH
jgi:hypothetical protein